MQVNVESTNTVFLILDLNNIILCVGVKVKVESPPLLSSLVASVRRATSLIESRQKGQLEILQLYGFFLATSGSPWSSPSTHN